MEPTTSSKKEELHRQEFGDLYEFFKIAEQSERHLTSKEIREEGFHRSIKTVRKYISRHWSWFLHPVDSSKRPVVYRCQGIGEYPKEYFIQAHKPDQMQYFYHFAKSIEVYEKRREEERQKRLEAEASVEQLPGSEIEQLEEAADQQKAPPSLDIQIAEETEPAEPVEQAEPDEASDPHIEDEEAKLIDNVEPELELHLQALPESREHVHIMPPSAPLEETPESPHPVESPLEDNSEKLSGEAGIKIHNISEPPKSPRMIMLIIIFLVLLALIVAGYIAFRKWLPS